MSNLRDLLSGLDARESLRPAAHESEVDGQTVDLLGCDGNVIVATVGAAADADGDTVFAVLESDSASSGFTVAAADDVRGLPVKIEADSFYQFSYTGSKQFIRVRVVTGGAATVAASAMVVKGYLHREGATVTS